MPERRPFSAGPLPDRPGLTIHALNARTKRYEETAASEMLTGWTSEEIHLALNEAAISRRTWAAVERVGRALGQKEGTKPVLDPIQRRQLSAARTAGRKEGSAAATASERAATVRTILAQRGIDVPPAFLGNAAARRLLLPHDTERIVAAASSCRSAVDFLARLAAP